MPRSGPPSYTYTLPPIYLAIPGTTITAAQHNDPLQDIAATFNTVQPVVWGGTGSGNAAGARSNLGLTIGTDVAGIDNANVFTQNQTVRLSDDGATEGPLLTLDRLSASPAANDVIGAVLFNGRDSGGTVQGYAGVEAQIVSPTASSEAGRLLLRSTIAGALGTRAYVGAGIYTPNAAGGDKGADSINAVSYYLNGGSMIPSGFLYGATIANNALDATNSIDFSTGQAIDSTNVSMASLPALTKQLNANWAAGNNQGMRYSGAGIANTTYHLYAVWKAGGVDPDYYADPSASAATALGHLQAETGGASYAYVRRIGSIVRAAGAIKAFIQDGDQFYWNSSSLTADYTGGARAKSALTVAVPSGIRVQAIFQAVALNNGSSDKSVIVFDGVNTNIQQYFTNGSSVGITTGAGTLRQFTDTSAQIQLQVTNAGTGTLYTLGWVDTRGRNGP